MELLLWQILILIAAGLVVGISMSFIGQTGSGIVIPIVFLMTGDILMAIAANIFNDFIAATVVFIFYAKNKNYHFSKDYIYFFLFDIVVTVGCVALLMFTTLGNAFGWLLPIMFIVLGLGILRKGFPTAESIKRMVHNITERFLKGKKSEEEIKQIEEKMDEQLVSGNEIIEGVIPIGSKFYYIVLIIVGMILGVNSGLFGAAGGFIIAVVLILFGYPLKKAVGTALLFSIFICVSTFVIYQCFGIAIKGQFYFDINISICLGVGTFIMGIISSIYVQKMSAKTMGMAMGGIMILLGITTLTIFLLT